MRFKCKRTSLNGYLYEIREKEKNARIDEDTNLDYILIYFLFLLSRFSMAHSVHEKQVDYFSRKRTSLGFHR